MNKLTILNIIVMVLLLVLTIYMFKFALNNKEKVETDPLSYGAKIYNIDYCSCYMKNGKTFFYNGTNIWIINPINNSYKINTDNITEELRKRLA